MTLLLENIQSHFTGLIREFHEAYGELTLIIEAQHLRKLCFKLRDEAVFKFEQLMDVTLVDYLHYGQSEWETHSATSEGFDRGVDPTSMMNLGAGLSTEGSLPDSKKLPFAICDNQRFAIVYHLLSLSHNQRLRLKVFLDEKHFEINSVNDIWPSANWFEREAYDLFGIYFVGHPDLRRLLTDEGFKGYPLRKDFPLSGHVEVRYDAEKGEVIYEPINLERRVLVPKVIRKDKSHV